MDENNHLDGQLTYQLSLIVPSYTKASSLYRTLMDILNVEQQTTQMHHDETPGGGDPLAAKRAAGKRSKSTSNQATPEPLLTPDGPQPAIATHKHFRHTDVLLQFELRQLLKQKLLLPDLQKTAINNLHLTYVTVVASTLLSARAFDTFVLNRHHPRQLIDHSQALHGHGFIEFIIKNQESRGIQDRNRIENCAAVFVVQDKLLVVKENWHEWQYKKSVDAAEFRAYQAAVVKAHEKKKGGGPSAAVHLDEEEEDDPRKAALREMNDRNLVRLFDIVLCVECDEINQVRVHKGKDPSVEIKCYDNEHRINLLFTGDMERQLFIDNVFEVMQRAKNPNLDETEAPTLRRLGASGKDDADAEDEDDGEPGDELLMDQPASTFLDLLAA